jgi:hypothetical protein
MSISTEQVWELYDWNTWTYEDWTEYFGSKYEYESHLRALEGDYLPDFIIEYIRKDFPGIKLSEEAMHELVIEFNVTYELFPASYLLYWVGHPLGHRLKD